MKWMIARIFMVWIFCAWIQAEKSHSVMRQTIRGLVRDSREVEIQLSLGTLKGEATDGYRSFLGIPFIEAPVGPLRFKKPVPKKPWDGVLDATSFGAGCPQSCKLPPGTCPASYSEDCISLNIYTPDNVNDNSNLPVVVFFPGGHFDQGGANVKLYDGSYVVKRTNVIMVNVGYRIGALGWLAVEELGLRGNLGFLDQRVALEWIRDHISAFGGNPDSVTISGQSAGGVSVLGHLVSKKSWGLFHRAIISSNPLVLPIMNVTTLSQNFGKNFMKAIGCQDLDCLMSASTDQIVEAQETAEKKLNFLRPLLSFLPLTLVVDNDNLYYNGFEAIMNGHIANVPIMMGSTVEESLLFIHLAFPKRMSAAKYIGLVTGIFWRQAAAAKVLSYYTPAVFKKSDKRDLFAKMGSDYIFHCSQRYVLNHYANITNRAPVYYYEVNQTLSFDGWGPNYPFCMGHSCHGVELVYRFHSASHMDFSFSDQEETLSNLIIDSFDNFIKTGNPNTGDAKLPNEWPRWDPVRQPVYRYSASSGPISDPHRSACDMWDSMGNPYQYGI